MSHDELDAACEEYLNRTYGEQVDFAIERSLPELLRDGMVQEDGQVLIFILYLAHASNQHTDTPAYASAWAQV